MDDLKNPNAGLYIYITVTGGSQGKDVADIFRKYFKEYCPNRALTLVYLKLQSDGGINLGSKCYLSADELAEEKDGSQIDLIKKAVKEKDSQLLVWLSDIYGDYFKSTEEFGKLSIPDQFFLLGLLPFLSFKELTGSNGEAALKDLIDNYPGRSDLFEAYVAQGLPLKGQIITDFSYAKKTPIDYVVRNFDVLTNKHGFDTIFNLIRLLNKLGADINECSGDGTYPLLNAFNANKDYLVKLLLELGAVKGKYHELVEQRVEKERIEAENKRKEAERRAKQEKKERKEREREQKTERRREILHKIIFDLRILPVLFMACSILLSVFFIIILWSEDADIVAGPLAATIWTLIPFLIIFFTSRDSWISKGISLLACIGINYFYFSWIGDYFIIFFTNLLSCIAGMIFRKKY
jgi:hypothetical protein